ncbi:maleylpyruvate isomerase family mycothiol-dependent enzyme [Streptosporangium sp. NPDC000239]|uniref:maleylpyruvate isomerase family mycothiol-dependent enzyme n=1 Tax=Streptosporangium sp. NPDC000239 TaxID=3154248 RepID=UPI00331C16E8
MNKPTPLGGTAVHEPVPLGHDRHCAEIVAQTDQLRAVVAGADLAAAVPSCPDWNLAQLLRHVGYGHRWAETIVRTRATTPPPDTELRDLPADTGQDPAEIDAWLAEGARLLADTLREAGPDARTWVPVETETSGFWARRFAHETLVHRADAALAAGRDFTAGREVVVDALDEWMELASLPQMLDVNPRQRELLGPGRTIGLHATDTGPSAGTEWLVDLTGDTVTCRRGRGAAAVTLHGPLTALLLVVYRRRPARGGGVEILGDERLLDFWLDRVGFG